MSRLSLTTYKGSHSSESSILLPHDRLKHGKIPALTGFETTTSHFLAVLINCPIKVMGTEFSITTNFRVLRDYTTFFFVNNQLDAQFLFMYVYFYSLHVSGNHVPIIRRIDCTGSAGLGWELYSHPNPAEPDSSKSAHQTVICTE